MIIPNYNLQRTKLNKDCDHCVIIILLIIKKNHKTRTCTPALNKEIIKSFTD